MKKNILKIFILISVFLVFISCSVKEYSGFPVNQKIIQIQYDDDNILSMPLEFYKVIEKELCGFSDKYNYFADVSLEDFEYYRNLTKNIYSLDLKDIKGNRDNVKKSVSKIVSDEKELSCIIDSFTEMDINDIEKNELFVKELSDYFDVLIYVMGEVYDFDNNKAPWYESRKAMFEDAVNDKDVQISIGFIEKYFPAVEFIFTYEETGAGKLENEL